MPDPIPVFIVKASTGCYEDAFEYLVAAYFDKAAADEHCSEAEAWVSVNTEKYVERYSGCTVWKFPVGGNPHDPRMYGEPASYSVTTCMVHDRPKRRK